eukprot:6195117-Pleurochrysis_carterae.AAC.2
MVRPSSSTVSEARIPAVVQTPVCATHFPQQNELANIHRQLMHFLASPFSAPAGTFIYRAAVAPPAIGQSTYPESGFP